MLHPSLVRSSLALLQWVLGVWRLAILRWRPKESSLLLPNWMAALLMDLHLAISYPKVTKFRAAGLR